MKLIWKLIVVAAVGLFVLGYALTYVWPVCSWDMRLPSPGGRYDLVVLRRDAAAFADFSYRIYVFPHDLTPGDRLKDEFVFFASPWRGSKYLIYDGYNYPLFRWTDDHSVEIRLHCLEYSPATFEPIKMFGRRDQTVLVSLAFGEPQGVSYNSP
jgi:hypothetical protein